MYSKHKGFRIKVIEEKTATNVLLTTPVAVQKLHLYVHMLVLLQFLYSHSIASISSS